MARLVDGEAAPRGTLLTTDEDDVPVPDRGQLLHLYFSRFADCPICNLHIANLRRRTPELVAAGVRTIAIFHSPVDQVRHYRTDMPFALVADPDKAIYKRYSVTPSRRALLHPRAIRRLIAERRAGNRAQEAHGGVHGMPADFLITPEGRLLLARYGKHADDNVSVDELLAAATRH